MMPQTEQTETFRLLRADEVEVRVGQISKSGSSRQWYSLLLYKDARCDMSILDETLGSFGWQRDHKEIKGVVYCGVGIVNPVSGQLIWKWDAGSESNTEKEKGEASDSFKRACVNWGIGRELYTSPKMFVSENWEEIGKRRMLYVKTLTYKQGTRIIGAVTIGDYRNKDWSLTFVNY